MPNPPSLPTSLHLTYFTVYSSFQPIFALSDCMHLRVTEGGWPRRFWFGLNPSRCGTQQHNRALVTDKLCLTGIVTHSIPFFPLFLPSLLIMQCDTALRMLSYIVTFFISTSLPTYLLPRSLLPFNILYNHITDNVTHYHLYPSLSVSFSIFFYKIHPAVLQL